MAVDSSHFKLLEIKFCIFLTLLLYMLCINLFVDDALGSFVIRFILNSLLYIFIIYCSRSIHLTIRLTCKWLKEGIL